MVFMHMGSLKRKVIMVPDLDLTKPIDIVQMGCLASKQEGEVKIPPLQLLLPLGEDICFVFYYNI